MDMTIAQLNQAFDEEATPEKCHKLIEHCLKEVEQWKEKDAAGVTDTLMEDAYEEESESDEE